MANACSAARLLGLAGRLPAGLTLKVFALIKRVCVCRQAQSASMMPLGLHGENRANSETSRRYLRNTGLCTGLLSGVLAGEASAREQQQRSGCCEAETESQQSSGDGR